MVDIKGLTVKKNENFSEWFTEVVQKAELADMRFNVKGFLVFQPSSVMVMEKMYSFMETALRKKGHKPYWFPTVIPEGNFKKEAKGNTHAVLPFFRTGFIQHLFYIFIMSIILNPGTHFLV